jgi:integrase/recombinase XerD
MPASAKLIPKHRPRREALGHAAWELAIPPWLSDTGKEKRLFFPTKKAAALTALQLQSRQDNFGLSLSSLSSVRIAEASEAYDLLEGTSLGLLEAVRIAKAIHATRTGSVPFLELYNRFLETKSHCHRDYQFAHRQHRDRYPQLHAKLASDITTAELEKLLKPLGLGARDHAIKYWRAVFNYGIAKKFLAGNPIDDVDRKEIVSDEAAIIPNEHVRGLLNYALENDLQLLPYFVFGFFAGLRPDGELLKLDWASVRFNTRKIIMTRRITKKKQTRYPELNDTAIAWLRAYEARGGPMTGQVVTYGESALRTARVKAQQAAGLDKWIQQGARHTFTSNWLAVHKNEDKLALMNGHSRDVLWDSYVHGLTEEEGRAYFNILPPDKARTIVPFVANA